MKTVTHYSDTRGHVNHGWLQARHSFSFASFYNADRMNFGTLRVLNDDIIAPNMGFGAHPHDNMEIITIPLTGALKHRDSLANQWQSVLPGEVQIMSAGKGIEHSEMNASTETELKLFQIWIIPNKRDINPRYDQKFFFDRDRHNKFQTLVSSYDDDDTESLKIYQDVRLSRISLDKGRSVEYFLKSKCHGVYVMTIDGVSLINNTILKKRDAIGVSEINSFKIVAQESSDMLLIEVPMS